MASTTKPKLAVWKFASCDGCQLSLLDCEDELLAVAGAVDIANFPEASRAVVKGPYDVSPGRGLDHDAARRRADHGDAPGLASPGDHRRLRHRRRHPGAAELQGRQGIHSASSTPAPEYIDTLEQSTPISDHVQVDFELRGCPINKYQLVEVISALLNGRKPNMPPHSVCMECKRRGTVCVMVAHGTPCLGPVTQAGCGAICPSYHRGCYGCFGPMETPNTASLSAWWSRLGVAEEDICARLPQLQRLRRSVPQGERSP